MVQPVGYFKLWRELMVKPIWLESTPEQKTILITLLAMANFGEKEWEWQGRGYKAKKGQFITSLPSIAKNAGINITIQNVRTALKRFEKYGFLTDQSTNRNRLITIVNWGLYQQNDSELTGNLTGSQQATNRQLTSREEGKEGKEGKNNISSGVNPQKKTFFPPSFEEVKEYCKERNNNVDAEKWHDFYSSKGWMIGKNKMKDWKAAVRTWEKSGEKPNTPNPKSFNNFTPREYDTKDLKQKLLARSRSGG